MSHLTSQLKQHFIEQFGVNLLNQELFRRIKISNEARRALEEIPELIKFLDVLYTDPPQDFENRLLKFQERLKAVKGGQ